MTVHQLMTPRFKVIADFPGNMHEIGAIIERNDPAEFQKYPAIYKQLPWHYEREADELPLYVKYVENEKIDQVEEVKGWIYHEIEGKGKKTVYGFTYENGDEWGLKRMSVNGWEPATAEEYENFKNQ